MHIVKKIHFYISMHNILDVYTGIGNELYPLDLEELAY